MTVSVYIGVLLYVYMIQPPARTPPSPPNGYGSGAILRTHAPPPPQWVWVLCYTMRIAQTWTLQSNQPQSMEHLDRATSFCIISKSSFHLCFINENYHFVHRTTGECAGAGIPVDCERDTATTGPQGSARGGRHTHWGGGLTCNEAYPSGRGEGARGGLGHMGSLDSFADPSYLLPIYI